MTADRLSLRTEEHFARIDRWRDELRDTLAAILSSRTAFDWEIGCGHGHFLVDYARAHPERLCIGIDIMGERIERAQRKLIRARLPNLHFIRADARIFLEAVPAVVQISRTFVLFPDPWPKLRHHKHRVLQPEFLRALAQRVGPDSRLYFRTDHGEYFATTHALVSAHPDWKLAAEPWPFEFETVFQQKSKSYDSLTAQPRP